MLTRKKKGYVNPRVWLDGTVVSMSASTLTVQNLDMQGFENSAFTTPLDRTSVELTLKTFLRSDGEQANSTITEHRKEKSPWSALVFLSVLWAFGVLGNTLVLYIYQRRMKATIFGFFVQILAVVDLTTVLVVTVGVITNLLLEDLDTEWMCKFLVFMTQFPTLTSGFLLSIIAIQRYRQVCCPHGRRITKGLAAKLCLGVICLAFALSLPIVYLVSSTNTRVVVRNLTLVHTECDYDTEFKQNGQSIIYAFLVNVEFLGITIMLSCLYFNIGKTLRQRSKKAKGHINSAIGTKVFAILTTIFIVSVLPLMIISTIYSFYETQPVLNNVEKTLFDIGRYLPYMNCIVNPIVYGFTSRLFRQECFSCLTFSKRKPEGSPPMDNGTSTNTTSLAQQKSV